MSKSNWGKSIAEAWFPVLAHNRSKKEKIFGMILGYGSIASVLAFIFEKMWQLFLSAILN